jgi:RNA polymerase-associated protein LEO1
MHEVTNTVRWKWTTGTHGEDVKRTNTRVIRWSDGTASLMIGQEMWDLQTDGGVMKPFTRSAGEASDSQLQSQSQPPKPIPVTASRPTREGPISLLLSTDFDDEVLTSDSIITGSLSLVPLTRNVRDHQKRLVGLSKSTQKTSKILSYRDDSGIRPDKKIEESVKEMVEEQKKRLKAKGHDLNAGLSLPVWKGSTGGGGGGGGREREGSPLGRRKGGASTARRGRSSFSSDEDMDGRGGAEAYGAGEYESDDFVVSSSCITPVDTTC